MRVLVVGLRSLLLMSVSAQSQTLLDPNLTRSTWATGLTQPAQLDFLGPEHVLVVEYPAGWVRARDLR